jgi:hypothetical protein
MGKDDGMTKWQWWCGLIGDVDCGEGYMLGEFSSRVEAIIAGQKEYPGQILCIIEAKSSEASEFDQADVVPFLRTRGAEVIQPDPIAVIERCAKLLESESARLLRHAEKLPDTIGRWPFKRANPDRQSIEGFASALDILADDLRDLES